MPHQVVLGTEASSGFGRSAAKALASAGHTVFELYLAASRDPQLSAIAIKCIDAYRHFTRKALIAADVVPQRASALARWIPALVDGFAIHAAAAGTPQRSSPDLAEAIETLVRS